MTISPLAVPFPAMPTVAGVELAAVSAGLYRRERDDLVLMRFAEGTAAAGVFTRHFVGSAPVDWCRARLSRSPRARALVVNAGCANSFTGAAGERACARVARDAARRAHVRPGEVLLASTGVIGAPLDDAKIRSALPNLARNLAPDAWEAAARAIMTTDTFPKGACARLVLDGEPVALAGIAKGSGMIAPNMATMLAFVTTDIGMAPKILGTLVREGAAYAFNRVTVDGDRSTNDTLLLFATGAGSAAPIRSRRDPRLAAFKAALDALMLDLAQQLVRDGEGASRFVRVTVVGARSRESAAILARAIAESPLVKTAIAGADANWGRIVMAAGKTGEPVRRERLSVFFGPHAAARRGRIASDYSEEALSAYMQGRELEIRVEVGIGRGEATIWTCDLTKEYVAINADYRS